jgi:hypothetical protein
MHFKETQYGFEYGSATITRFHSDEKRGWIVLGLGTPKHTQDGGMQIYVTKTGKVRVFDSMGGEWTPPKKK